MQCTRSLLLQESYKHFPSEVFICFLLFLCVSVWCHPCPHPWEQPHSHSLNPKQECGHTNPGPEHRILPKGAGCRLPHSRASGGSWSYMGRESLIKMVLPWISMNGTSHTTSPHEQFSCSSQLCHIVQRPTTRLHSGFLFRMSIFLPILPKSHYASSINNIDTI